MAIPDWSPSPPSWSNETFTLLNAEPIVKPPNVTIVNTVDRCNEFPIRFPVQTVKCAYLQKYIDAEVLERIINSAYPIVHENVLEFFCKFILFKRNHGSQIEKDFYAHLTLKGFINRLLTKKAVMFVEYSGEYLLLNGYSGFERWETIGTDHELAPLILQDCLSYNEIKCSAFLSISSYTHFVNRGDRKNMGKYLRDRRTLEDEGVIIGLIGPRLVKEFAMEMEEIVFTENQNKKSNGYGTTDSTDSIHKLFSDFYEENCFDFEEVTKYKESLPPTNTRYTVLVNDCLFDNYFYYKRLTFSIDTLLMEANHRALLKKASAYVHVTEIGLGVWCISPHQHKVVMDTFASRIKYLGAKLSNISDICFAYVECENCGGYKHEELFPIEHHPHRGIKIHIYNRQPHDKLFRNPGEDKLLVVTYSADSNALPGNEYWSNFMGNSSDSAAASSTQIMEIHNPHINQLICADTLMVVTPAGLVGLEDYIKDVKTKYGFE